MGHSFHEGITSSLAKTNKALPLFRKGRKHAFETHSCFLTREGLKQANVK